MPSLGTKTVYAEPGPPYKTAEQMTEMCCEPRPKLPCREKVVGDIQPDMQKALENLGLTLDANGRDQNGRLVKLVYKERKNPCGKIVHRYKIEQKNCCGEVAPIVYDTDNSVDILAPGTSGIVRFTGGRLPVTVRVRGNGFSLDGYNQRDGLAYSRAFPVFAHEFACGTGPITLLDGCTVASGSVLSTDGHWDGICLAWGGVADRYYTNYRNSYRILTGFDDCGIPMLDAVTNGPNEYCTTFLGWCYYWDGDNWLQYWSSSNYMTLAAFDAIYDHLTGLGWNEDNPADFAPNGPGDLAALGLPLCSPSGAVCRFIC